jgi:hypothetical protein
MTPPTPGVRSLLTTPSRPHRVGSGVELFFKVHVLDAVTYVESLSNLAG